MQKSSIAVKSFTVRDGEVLAIKRRPNDVHNPNGWDIPGGRLNPGENPYKGLMRETKEEVGIEIEILLPLGVNHFTRDDGQKITMIIFLCRPKGINIRLSEEHKEYKWVNIDSGREELPSWLFSTVNNFLKYNLGKFVS